MIFVLARFLRRAPEELSVEDLKALKDEDLMDRFARGDVAAFELLVERHERPVYRFVLRSVRDDERAEELTQDVFLRVVNNAARYKPSAKFTTWLYTIARNACIDEARRRGRRPTVSLNAPVGDEDGATFLDRLRDARARGGGSEVARASFRDHLETGIAALPELQREVFLLRQFEGMRFVDIAQQLGVSDNTVKSRMRYALATLRDHLADFGGVSFDEDDAREVGEGAGG